MEPKDYNLRPISWWFSFAPYPFLDSKKQAGFKTSGSAQGHQPEPCIMPLVFGYALKSEAPEHRVFGWGVTLQPS